MRTRLVAIAAAVALILVACGDTADPPATDITTVTTEPTAPPVVTTTPPEVVDTTSTVPADPPTTTVPSTPPTTVAPPAGAVGEFYDLWVPQPAEGPILGVVGVRHDDVLNVRSGPGVEFDAIATLEPTATGIVGTGQGWQLPSGAVWWQIEADGVVGWANQRYLSRLSGVDDLTSFVTAELDRIPAAETMLDLGLAVTDAVASGTGMDVVVSVAPTVGDLGEVTYDVSGPGDDSIGGYRLHVFGEPTAGGEGFALMAVEATTLCQRGVHEGRCT